ncbi:MAG: glycosyltransferase [Desulfococcaceae bacterium]|jgi:GR25 family glycosyltransferase involved in LPS biosynthesis|nr:glycosyltransferase [Desulfococcaceae bacterium]
MLWDYFDKIYCISLREREDRREEAEARFREVGLHGRVEFLIVEKHPEDCEQGIYESHMLCMVKGIHAGARRILVFEDDIVFDRFSDKILENSISFMENCPDWHMLFLGCMVRKSRKTDNPSVLKIRYRSLGHAYAIRREFAEKLVQIPWRKVPFDDFLRDMKDEHMYAVFPSFAFQSNSRSDNERYLPLDRIRRIFGGLMCLQKQNEFFQRNRNLIIALHFVIIAVIAVKYFF